MFVSAICFTLIGWAGASIFSWRNILSLGHFPASDVDHTVAVCMTLFAATIPLSLGQRILLGLGRNDLVLYSLSTSSLFTLAIAWLLSSGGTSGIELAVSIPAGVLLSQLICFVLGLHTYALPLGLAIFGETGEHREIMRTAAPMLVLLIALPAAIQGQRLIVSWSDVPTALAVYGLAMQIYSPIWSFIAATSGALWPMFAKNRSHSAGKAQVVRQSLAIFFGVGAFAGAGTILFGDAVASLISHGTIHLSVSVVISMGFMLFVQAVQQVPGMYLTDSRGLAFQSLCVVVMTIANLALSVTYTPIYGPWVPFAATALSVMAFQVIPGVARVNTEVGLLTPRRGRLRIGRHHRLEMNRSGKP
ncbi:O-antigen/teichoic acid export membrane protein [Sinomonas atrocyanea]|uniref:lipopolysaccharide biosynthesis protein n=1 Tax=Sinomonas atrocyanea TaxID=37927 RepID=UPI0027849D89|nr:hypothetical protein [Sinomonas atrocyanea]MDP9885842.1 O-antigen/teichoic acid export membrane protein [Sinomonas atrocyanea]